MRRYVSDRVLFALTLFIYSTVFIFIEFHCSKIVAIVEEVSKQVQPIGDNVDPSSIPNGQLVMYHTSNIQYSLVEDPDFGMGEYCGQLQRMVQYCMWQEYEHSYEVNNVTEYYYTYSKIWSSYPINSFYFHNPAYHNPHVEIVPEKTFHNNMEAGTFLISDQLTFSGRTETLQPHNQQISEFSNSPYAGEFKFAGKGIFYSTYQKRALDSLLHVAQFFDLSERGISRWCEPGDRRVWFQVWAPDQVTIIGQTMDGSILPITLYDYKIGSAISGFVDKKTAVTNNFSGFPTALKWILRLTLVGITIYMWKNNISINYSYYGVIFVGAFIAQPWFSGHFNITKSNWYLFAFSAVIALPNLVMRYLNYISE